VTNQHRDCYFVVIGRPSHPTILCSTAKIDPVGPSSPLANIGVYRFLPVRDLSVPYPEEYLGVYIHPWFNISVSSHVNDVRLVSANYQ